jgi:hypothetical protein
MSFATLLLLIQKGRVTARSVIRGPTTSQFWRHAAKVKGVSREFGLCWNCGQDVARGARVCGNCKRMQEPPMNPDVLLELGGETAREVTEKMWAEDGADGVAESSSPVDRLAARGGVRREIPAQARAHPPQRRDVETVDDLTEPVSRVAATVELPRAETREERIRRRESAARDTGARDIGARGIASHRGAGGLGMGYHDDLEDYHLPRGRRGGGFFSKLFKVIMTAVLLGAIGVAVIVYLDPDGAGRRFREYAQRAWAWGKQMLAPAQSNGASSGAGGAAVVPAGGGAAPSAAKQPSSAPDSAAGEDFSRLTPEQAKYKVYELWEEGEAASLKGDHKRAVSRWEAIKRLPGVKEEDWPLGLDARIELARKKIK